MSIIALPSVNGTVCMVSFVVTCECVCICQLRNRDCCLLYCWLVCVLHPCMLDSETTRHVLQEKIWLVLGALPKTNLYFGRGGRGRLGGGPGQGGS
ncbi:hypothetical protein BKA64DRAFT_238990 [Cadophora sp. MPI-SDFR-AT-0126]|nr:hypothetical protein BKA64DRAFT_238990 [Leotiomycetes sp. MPI-SDFR-AT-0126]